MKPRAARPSQAARRAGFTLVEMLVSTALVLLIMVLFAQIYGAAVGSIREQEGIAKNDQKARSVINMMRGDLRARSYREIPLAVTDPNKGDLVARGLVPIHPRLVAIDTAAQRGFFYLSENDPGDDTDDVLSFTVLLQTDVGKYTGRVRLDGATRVNHPDSDDSVQDDGMTVSRAAVVTYFLQDGKLHRRINLLRDPLCIPSPWNPDSGALYWLPTQPSDETTLTTLGTGNQIFSGTDYANWYQDNGLARLENPPTSRLRVLGIESLDNTQLHADAPIGLPRNREGHNSAGNPTGEYTGGNFQGRDPLQGGRQGEDIILGNVVGFDVKVWEPKDANLNGAAVTDSFEGPFRGGRFIDLGHGVLAQPDGSAETAETGPFRNNSGAGGNATWGKLNTAYSPGGSSVGVFDTWHPLAPSGTTPPAIPNALPANLAPPYYPLKVSSAATTASSTWNANASVNVDSSSPFDWTKSNVFFPWGYLGDYSIGYRVTTAGTTGTVQPVWSRIIGNQILDGTARWECFDNRIGLTAIRVTVRFVDPGSNLVRQVTLDHSFLD